MGISNNHGSIRRAEQEYKNHRQEAMKLLEAELQEFAVSLTDISTESLLLACSWKSKYPLMSKEDHQPGWDWRKELRKFRRRPRRVELAIWSDQPKQRSVSPFFAKPAGTSQSPAGAKRLATTLPSAAPAIPARLEDGTSRSQMTRRCFAGLAGFLQNPARRYSFRGLLDPLASHCSLSRSVCGLALGRISDKRVVATIHFIEGNPSPHQLKGKIVPIATRYLEVLAVYLGIREISIENPVPDLIEYYKESGFVRENTKGKRVIRLLKKIII
ncbi:hypothetical protein RP726_05625 [Candidatus Methylospira mobilis]|uniref:hypothetical protein n=1 Tax=Candidatus Methylospira mobilis TaxID=1808979 RepID=UPI0028EE1664|nr:hypothetical protein [Candidatus Methylospira mobilis]WNV05891.1 hypothetical protein RP726_05625 [Candidatus Methylospira mobilis]